MSGMTTHTFGEMDAVLSDSLSVSLELLNDIIAQINTIDTYTPEKEFHYNQQLMKMSSDITNFVEVTTLISKILTVKKKVSLPIIKESHIHLLFVLKGINQAQQKHDAVVLEDLIKYELKDNLTQWKIDLIPLIKRQLSF